MKRISSIEGPRGLSESKVAEVKEVPSGDTIKTAISKEILKFIKIHREDRNAKMFYKVLLIFTFQIGLLYCMLYAIFIGPLVDGKTAE